MSDPEPIDLSQLQHLNLAPDWVGDLQKREATPGEVIWGRAPEHERESRGGGQGQGYGGGGAGGNRGPRRDGGGFGARQDFNRPGGPPRGPRPDGPRGPGQENRGPRPGGFGGPGGPRPDGPRGPRPDGPPRGDGPRGPRQDDRGPRPGGPPGDRGPRPNGPPRDDRRGGPDRREGGGGRPDFRNDRVRHPGRFDDRPYIEPLPGWRARLFAEPRSLEAITRQVKASGRAYPVFELGRLFLAGRDRYVVELSRQPQPQLPRNAPKGTPAPAAEALPGPEQIYHIPSEGSLWLNRDEAIRHLINGPSLQKFYRKETVSVDPPKGIFNAVAVCGFSGEILGPPNHHSFQTTVARLHREQFYNLPIDRYKARIRTEKDETLVAKWLEEQSTTTVYIPLTAQEIAAKAAAEAAVKVVTPAKPESQPDPVAESEPAAEAVVETPETATNAAAATPSGDTPPVDETPPVETTEAIVVETETPADAAEPLADATESAETEPAAEVPVKISESSAEADVREPAPPVEPLKNWAAVEAHFIANHAPDAVRAVSRIEVPGNIPGKLLAPSLLALLRREVEQQQRFPMQLVQDLCRDLEKESLKFFKRDKKATFVCRTRPHFIDDESHLSPRLRSIVGVVRANPGITVGKLVSTLAPHNGKAVTKPEAPKAAAAEAPAVPVEEEVPQAGAAASDESTAGTECPVAEAAPVNAGETPALSEDSPANEVPDPPAPPAESTTIPHTEKPAASASEKPARDPRERGPKNQRNKKPAPAPEGPPAPLTMEEIGVLQDLRWLVGEGLVTEFATGELQILGRPPQPPAEKKPRPDSKSETAKVASNAVEGNTASSSSEPESVATASSETPVSEETVLADIEVAAAEDVLQDEGNPLPNTHGEPES